MCDKFQLVEQLSITDTITAICNRIQSLCAKHNITINKLATSLDLPPSSIKNILYGKSMDPKILTIKKICDGLGITLIDFFDSPEFAELEQEIKPTPLAGIHPAYRGQFQLPPHRPARRSN
nr:helix-turn-helix transcriptional regulator [Acutalibacter sp. 1XD8-36]